MVNYNQKYKNEVIVTIKENKDNLYYDSSVTDNGFFSAVGQKTSGNLNNISQVNTVNFFAVKPDTILNLKDGNIKVYDDDGNIGLFTLSGLSNKQVSYYGSYLPDSLRFSTLDTNIRFDNFNALDGMTKDIGDLINSENVETFDLKITTPNDVKCNYTTGKHLYIKGQAVNITFDGNIKKGDTITIKRNGRKDTISNIQFDSDLIFSNLGFDGVTNGELIYTHGDTPQPPKTVEKTTVEFTSSDKGIQWQNATMIDDGSNFTNPVIIQKGYEIIQPLAIEFTDKNDKTGTLTYGSESDIYFDGDKPNKNIWNLTINAGYKKLNIKAGQTKYKTYNLETNIQNAKIIEPQPATDGKYYLDQQHKKITVVANNGYTFENDGSFTYYQPDILDNVKVTITANHSNSMTITLPSDIDWAYQHNVFQLTIGAVKSDIITSTGGFTNIYKADYNNLLKFSNQVIVKITGISSVQSYDVSPYIDNLIMLPFNVPTGAESSIVVGNEAFNTQLPTVDINFLTVDLGKITVNEQYKNGFDYYQVKTRLMLPYTNMVDLDPIHVINKTVSIQYVVNVVNGDTTINVYSDNDLFLSQQVNLANEIPFISKSLSGRQYAVINQLKTHFRNEINQAYIIIEQPTPILNADYYKTNEKGTLKNYTGNVKASLLNNVNINSNELNALQNLLETGVKIK